MRTRETAVTFYVLGLLTGTIVAFASCGTERPAGYPDQQMPSAQYR